MQARFTKKAQQALYEATRISKRLGHAKVSTTEDIYAHVIEAADQRNADILSDVFLKRA